MLTRRIFVAAAVALGATAIAGPAAPAMAQTYPNRAITLVVPFAAGGSTDIVARLVAQKMGELLGQQVVVENRAGAGGNLGAASVVRAEPDGYTILMGTISTHALNPLMAKKSHYDPVKDFEPVSLLALVPNVLVVTPSLPVKDVKELIALLKANPEKYSYASSGLATPLHLSGEMFKRMAGVQMTHVPYRGSGPALNDVVAGHVPIQFDNLPSASEHIKSGQLRALAVTTKERAPSMPDIPTMAEAGLPGYETYTWNALFAPAKTPKDIIDKLNATSRKAVADPQVEARLKDLSATVVGSTAEALGQHVRDEIARWTPITVATGVKID